MWAVTRWALVVLCALVLAPTASATPRKALNDSKLGNSKLGLQAQITHSQHVLLFFEWHGKGNWLVARERGCMAVPWRTTCRVARATERHHRWLLGLSKVRLTEILEREAMQAVLDGAWGWYESGSTQCVTNKEGGWRSISPGGTYHGRFQADSSFQWSYGYAKGGQPGDFVKRWGSASAWPPWAQAVMGWRGWLARGWGPWPNTARECGLL